jgi:hypothetical protein
MGSVLEAAWEAQMIRHVSISVREPERVARALAEAMGGLYWPFPPRKGSFFVSQRDEHGSMLEVHQLGTLLRPDTEFGWLEPAEPSYVPTHMAISVDKSIEQIKAIADRENWLCRRNDRAQFPVLEFWVENRMMIEFLPPDFAAAYLKVATGPPGPPPGVPRA